MSSESRTGAGMRPFLESLWMLGAAFFFALMGACVKLASVEAGTFEIVFCRSFLGLLFLVPVLLARRCDVRTKHLSAHLRRSFFGVTSFTIWFACLGHLPLGTGMTLNYTAPLFIALVTVFLALRRGARPPWALAAAVALGFAGVCLVLRPSLTPSQLPWAGAGLLAGMMGPLIFFQLHDLGRLGEPSWRTVFYFSLVGSLWGAAGCLLLEGGFSVPDARQALFLLGVGGFALLGQLCLTRAYGRGAMMLTACLQFSAIPMSEAISIAFFGESFAWLTAAGIALIVAAGSAASVIARRTPS